MFGNLGNLINQGKAAIDETEQIDEHFYAEVMDELSQGFKDKALVGKAIAQCDGNEGKFDSIYMKLRAKALQEKNQLHNKITKTGVISQQKKFAKIRKDYQNGYFHDLYRDEIKQKGFTSPWYAPNRLFSHDVEFYTKLDLEKMRFLIVDSKGNVIQSFHFKLN